MGLLKALLWGILVILFFLAGYFFAVYEDDLRDLFFNKEDDRVQSCANLSLSEKVDCLETNLKNIKNAVFNGNTEDEIK